MDRRSKAILAGCVAAVLGAGSTGAYLALDRYLLVRGLLLEARAELAEIQSESVEANDEAQDLAGKLAQAEFGRHVAEVERDQWARDFRTVTENRFLDARRIELQWLSTDDATIRSAFERSSTPDEAVATFAAFHEHLNREFSTARPAIRDQWNVEDETVQRAIFYSMKVGSLWEYGNRNRPDLSGCTNDNEVTGGPVGYIQSQRQFLSSRIGCCNDYAYLMKILFDLDGVDSTILYGDSHLLNEFVSEGQRYVVDANTGITVQSGWAALAERDRDIRVWRYAVAGSRPSAGERYRPILGSFADYMMQRIGTGGFAMQVIEEVPRTFPLEDGRSVAIRHDLSSGLVR